MRLADVLVGGEQGAAEDGEREDVSVECGGRLHDHPYHYGHFDLLMGRRAHAEVFPHIDRWLDEHDD